MNDAQQERLSALRAKLRRIDGHKEWSPKQEQSAMAIVREIVKLDGTDIDELFELFRVKDTLHVEFHARGSAETNRRRARTPSEQIR
jgi:hypothetical protein